MTRLTNRPEFDDFVLGYEHTAFRLERQQRYNEAEEAEPIRRFLAGEPLLVE